LVDFFFKQITVLSVDEGAVLDAFFERFAHDPPSGYDRILLEQSLLET